MSVNKTQKISSALAFLQRYHKDGDKFLNHIVRVIGEFVNAVTKTKVKAVNAHTFTKQTEKV
jgi:hypothetical protein